MSLAALGVAALVVALWPEDRAPAAPYRHAGAQAAPELQPFEGGLRLPPDAHEPRVRKIWL
jgi:hypothetical protein